VSNKDFAFLVTNIISGNVQTVSGKLKYCDMDDDCDDVEGEICLIVCSRWQYLFKKLVQKCEKVDAIGVIIFPANAGTDYEEWVVVTADIPVVALSK
jgi:hypothetical protein